MKYKVKMTRNILQHNPIFYESLNENKLDIRPLQ